MYLLVSRAAGKSSGNHDEISSGRSAAHLPPEEDSDELSFVQEVTSKLHNHFSTARKSKILYVH